VVQVLSPENCVIDILDTGRTIRDFIDDKIKEKQVNFALLVQDDEEPFYVANLDSIFERQLRWRTNLPRVKPFYAVKCNNDAAVLRMSALDSGFNCASGDPAGAVPDKIIYAHTTKPLSHIKYACTHGVDTITFDNKDELLKISRCHAKANQLLSCWDVLEIWAWRSLGSAFM
uniref:Orn/DAP/Arg decarboxylase 2 N-terminal domain-containing protein n=1 Tax=Cyclopterus lumpus TaxID=8103 RepID=A0A8C2X571_CYCLU